MALMVTFNEPKVTPEAYDAVRAEIDWDHEPPPGCLMHAAAFDEAGFHSVDIWESEDELKAYFDTRLEPALRRLGILVTAPSVVELRTLVADQSLPALHPTLGATALASTGEDSQHGVGR